MRTADVSVLAGSLSFATVLSLVPLLAVSLSVFSAFGGFESLIDRMENFIFDNFIEASGANVSRFIDDSIGRIQSGKLGVVGAIALFIVSTKLFVDVEKAVQHVWQDKSRRFHVRRLFVYWTVMFGGPLILAIALGLIGSKDIAILRFLPTSTIAWICSFIGFLIINRFLPSKRVSWGSAALASIAAATGVALAQSFYARITAKILAYSAIYGSLASIPMFLLWIFLLWWICLAGVAFCATLEREKEIERRLGL